MEGSSHGNSSKFHRTSWKLCVHGKGWKTIEASGSVIAFEGSVVLELSNRAGLPAPKRRTPHPQLGLRYASHLVRAKTEINEQVM